MDKKKILLIDNEKDFTDVVKMALEATEKYEVTIENKGANGFVVARAMKPNLILLDIVMPDMEGSAVAAQIKDNESLKDTPLIFLTAALTREEAKTQGSVIGGCPIIAKPVSKEDLISCVEKNIS